MSAVGKISKALVKNLDDKALEKLEKSLGRRRLKKMPNREEQLKIEDDVLKARASEGPSDEGGGLVGFTTKPRFSKAKLAAGSAGTAAGLAGAGYGVSELVDEEVETSAFLEDEPIMQYLKPGPAKVELPEDLKSPTKKFPREEVAPPTIPTQQIARNINELKLVESLTGKQEEAVRPTLAGLNTGIARLAAPPMIANLSEANRQFYQERLEKIQGQRDALQETIKESMASARTEKDKESLVLGIAKALETLGHSMIQLGAANYGLRTGVDLSGLKFDKMDWTARQNAIDKNLRNRIKSITDMAIEQEKSFRSSEEEASRLFREQEKQEALNQRANAEKLWQRQRDEYKARLDRDEREKDRNLKRLDLAMKNMDRMNAKQVANVRKQIKEVQRNKKLALDRIEDEERKARDLVKLAEKDFKGAKTLLSSLSYLPESLEARKESIGFLQDVFTKDRTLFDDLITEHLNAAQDRRRNILEELEELEYRDDFAEDALLNKLDTAGAESVPSGVPPTAPPSAPAAAAGRQGFSSAADAIAARRGKQEQ